MTRNPDKYNKNAERNRLRDIESERRTIRHEAMRQVQCLAAIHDPSGVMFNVGPVVLNEDGSVISEETLRRREQRALTKAGAEQTRDEIMMINGSAVPELDGSGEKSLTTSGQTPPSLGTNLNPDRLARTQAVDAQQSRSRLSKSQQKKRIALEPRPYPPKPVIPGHVQIPEGEVDWLALWDLPDDQLERRLLREKRRKAAERKALRLKQQSGKAERRAARDEKRNVYRDMKLTWKSIKGTVTFLVWLMREMLNHQLEEQVRERTTLKSIEDEESKKIAVDINVMERQAALDHCATLGFTLINTPGVDDIKPQALGMKGVEVDFDAIDVGESRSDIKIRRNDKRVDLANVPRDAQAEYMPTGRYEEDEGDEGNDVEEYIKLDVGEGQDFETLNYNHKLRRKLRRAIDNAQIRKEMMVRQRALDLYGERHIEAPSVLNTPYKPINVKGQRILENGTFETPKQERVRARMELAEFNQQMRVLRKQAKDAAILAGLKKHAELTGRIAVDTIDVPKEEGTCVSQKAAETLQGRKDSPAAVNPSNAHIGDKRSREDDNAASEDSSNQSGHMSDSSTSESSAQGDPIDSNDETNATKRRKPEGIVYNTQSASTNSDRQAMIDAESALRVGTQEPHRRRPHDSDSLKEIDTNADRKSHRSWIGKGKTSLSPWNVDNLPGDNVQKGKFLRLLGGGEQSASRLSKGDSNKTKTLVDTTLERQYQYGVAYKKGLRRKGLGA